MSLDINSWLKVLLNLKLKMGIGGIRHIGQMRFRKQNSEFAWLCVMKIGLFSELLCKLA